MHNRTTARMRALVDDFGHDGDFVACESLPDLVAAVATPRTIVVMVQAGDGTDAVVHALTGLLDPGDVVVDAGNAHFADTRRREESLRERGIGFVGAGVSGGEEGALNGPSIMPGGSPEAYAVVGPVLESIAAVVDGEPCCTHLGPDGAGHFVKMVHNGIEYADMQLIAEAYDLLRTGLGAEPAEISEIFGGWASGELDSFLVDITTEVLAQADPRTGAPLVDVVLDQAEQKGTGRWTVQVALELGVPVSGIAEAVFARSLSGHAEQRDAARGVLAGPTGHGWVTDRAEFVEAVRQALYASKIVAYAQGFDLIAAGSEKYGWGIDPAAVARIWRGGCIIRAAFLDVVREAYSGADLPTLLVAPRVVESLAGTQDGWRRVVSDAALRGVPAPGFSAALAAYDGVRRERSPAALVQGLRDLFGAHTYRRVDDEGTWHLDWSGDRTERPA